MSDDLTQEKLAELRDLFTEKVDEVKTLPDRINDEFDKLKVLSFASYLLLTGTRDDMQEKLAELFDKLDQAVAGMFAPWLFVDYAAQWQALGAQVGGVSGRLTRVEFNMDGNWDGSAYKAYTASRTAQLAAVDALKGLCNSIHDELVAIAEDGRALYTAIVNKLGTIVAEVGVALGESAATGGGALLWVVNNMNAAIVAGVELIVEAITGFVENETKVYLATKHLENMIKNPAGLPTNSDGKSAWPTTESHEYDNQDDGWKQDGVEG
ncbi:hypothetical protein [Nocardia jinanensis]|uniref:Uncharacterized protein n=1 Tax=Nocardia jinanensis TaxID=382504 RepID=A0A917RPV2_9NOCA|nr:hypothetical protein [Nocardia jinanensis]GGL18445.1 hypothetical protein GCM10011588_36370 [Nocardia jinanensis]